MGVSVIDQERERLRLVPPAEPEVRAEVHNHFDWPAKEVVAVMSAIALVLAARVALILAGIGAFFLTYLVVNTPSTAGIVASVGYDLCVFAPLVYLALRKG